MKIMKMTSGLHINWERTEPVEHVSIKDYKAEKKAWKAQNFQDTIAKVIPMVVSHVEKLFS